MSCRNLTKPRPESSQPFNVVSQLLSLQTITSLTQVAGRVAEFTVVTVLHSAQNIVSHRNQLDSFAVVAERLLALGTFKRFFTMKTHDILHLRNGKHLALVAETFAALHSKSNHCTDFSQTLQLPKIPLEKSSHFPQRICQSWAFPAVCTLLCQHQKQRPVTNPDLGSTVTPAHWCTKDL
jgi:hypothetical protein